MKIISKKELYQTSTLEFKTEDGKYILAEKSTFSKVFGGNKKTLYSYILACRLLEGKKEEVMTVFDGKIPSGISFIKKDIEMAAEKYGVRITEADIAELAKSTVIYMGNTGGTADDIALNIALKNSGLLL